MTNGGGLLDSKRNSGYVIMGGSLRMAWEDGEVAVGARG